MSKTRKPTPDRPTELGRNLQRLMDRAKMTQYKMAKELAGTNDPEDVKKYQGTISRILTGVTIDPKVETLRAYVNVLNATLCDLYEDQKRADDIEDLASTLATLKPKARKAAIASAYASLEALGINIKDDQQHSQGPPPNANAA